MNFKINLCIQSEENILQKQTEKAVKPTSERVNW